MKAFKVYNDDIAIDETGNIAMVSGVDEVEQSLERILTTNIEEWFLNIILGLDYSRVKGKGKDKRDIRLALRDAIYQDERVDEVNFITVSLNPSARSLSVVMDILLKNGDILEGIEVSV